MSAPNEIARITLDERLDRWRNLPPVPNRGWIRAIRDALGMTTGDLAVRLGVTRQAVASLERSEAEGSIRLDTLRRAAAALDCTIVYAVVPNESLEAVVDRRAKAIATRDLDRVRQTMLLEDQAVDDPDTNERTVLDLAGELKRSRRLWRE